MFFRTTTLASLVMLVLLTGVASAAPIFVPVPVDASYLRIDTIDSAASPVFIDLATIPGIASGTLLLQADGGLCYSGAAQCMLSSLGGVFTTDATLGPSGDLNRLTAIGPPLGITSYVTPNTFTGNLATDIAQDFLVFNGALLSVAIPAGANYLAVGVIDGYYDDNAVWAGHDLGVEVEAAAIPEPGSLVLLAGGLLLISGLLRKRRAS